MQDIWFAGHQEKSWSGPRPGARPRHPIPDRVGGAEARGHSHVDELHCKGILRALGCLFNKQDVLWLEISVKIPTAELHGWFQGICSFDSPVIRDRYSRLYFIKEIQMSWSSGKSGTNSGERQAGIVILFMHEMDGVGNLPKELCALLFVVELDALQVFKELASFEHFKNHHQLVVVLK